MVKHISIDLLRIIVCSTFYESYIIYRIMESGLSTRYALKEPQSQSSHKAHAT